MQNDKTTYKSCFGSLCIAEKRHNNAFRGFGFRLYIWDFLAARFPSSRLWSPQSARVLVYGESSTFWKDMEMIIPERRARASSSSWRSCCKAKKGKAQSRRLTGSKAEEFVTSCFSLDKIKTIISFFVVKQPRSIPITAWLF